jgi:hypothetical protein
MAVLAGNQHLLLGERGVSGCSRSFRRPHRAGGQDDNQQGEKHDVENDSFHVGSPPKNENTLRTGHDCDKMPNWVHSPQALVAMGGQGRTLLFRFPGLSGLQLYEVLSCIPSRDFASYKPLAFPSSLQGLLLLFHARTVLCLVSNGYAIMKNE